jgi:hypothetical protein
MAWFLIEQMISFHDAVLSYDQRQLYFYLRDRTQRSESLSSCLVAQMLNVKSHVIRESEGTNCIIVSEL